MPNTPPAEIMDLINGVFKAYCNKDFDLFNSIYAGNVVIVDGFAPYRWTGTDALAKWWADVEVWVKAGGVKEEHLAFEGVRAWGVEGDRAYASTSATLTVKLNQGESIVRPGTLIFTFARQGNVWKAEGHTWGRLN
ncbi:MAG: nuclear transport factor 2 family protein [Gemmatales bacterium]